MLVTQPKMRPLLQSNFTNYINPYNQSHAKRQLVGSKCWLHMTHVNTANTYIPSYSHRGILIGQSNDTLIRTSLLAIPWTFLPLLQCTIVVSLNFEHADKVTQHKTGRNSTNPSPIAQVKYPHGRNILWIYVREMIM